MNETFRNLLFWASLFGLPMSGTCTTGCDKGDGGAYTMTDFLDDVDSHGIEFDGELELDRPAQVYAQQSFGADSGFRFKVQAHNRGTRYPVPKNPEANAKTEDDDMMVATTPENQ